MTHPSDETIATWLDSARNGDQFDKRGAVIVDSLLDRLKRAEEWERAWSDGVADVVEPYGFDREAANGPADLLPGLGMLVEAKDRAEADNVRLREWIATIATRLGAPPYGPDFFDGPEGDGYDAALGRLMLAAREALKQ